MSGWLRRAFEKPLPPVAAALKPIFSTMRALSPSYTPGETTMPCFNNARMTAALVVIGGFLEIC